MRINGTSGLNGVRTERTTKRNTSPDSSFAVAQESEAGSLADP